MRVLLIDDDTATLDVLDFTLSLEGHDVIRATDGMLGIELARTSEPALIVLDVMMPGLDGIETLKRLRAEAGTATTPVMMLSAKALEDDIWAGWTAGADSYLTKPLDVDLFHDEVERVCAAGAGEVRL